MPGCAVVGCKSCSRKTKGTNFSYHSFPKDNEFKKLDYDVPKIRQL